MHTEEPVAVQTLLELSQAHRGEVAVRVGLQVCVIVARHDEANLIDADEDLLAALFHRNALGLLGLHMQRNVLADACKRLGEALGLNRFHQVIDGVHLERVERMLAVGGDEHHRGREFQVLQRLGQLQASGFRHIHVEEHDIAGVLFELFDSLAHTSRLGNNLGLAKFVEQKFQFGARGGLVVDDDCFEHVSLPVRVR